MAGKLREVIADHYGNIKDSAGNFITREVAPIGKPILIEYMTSKDKAKVIIESAPRYANAYILGDAVLNWKTHKRNYLSQPIQYIDLNPQIDY